MIAWLFVLKLLGKRRLWRKEKYGSIAQGLLT